EPGRVAPWTRDALDQSHRDGVSDAQEDNRKRRRCLHGRHRCTRSAWDQHCRAAFNHFSHRLRGIAADLDDIKHDVAMFDAASLAQTLSKRFDERAVIAIRCCADRQATYLDWSLCLLCL